MDVGPNTPDNPPLALPPGPSPPTAATACFGASNGTCGRGREECDGCDCSTTGVALDTTWCGAWRGACGGACGGAWGGGISCVAALELTATFTATSSWPPALPPPPPPTSPTSPSCDSAGLSSFGLSSPAPTPILAPIPPTPPMLAMLAMLAILSILLSESRLPPPLPPPPLPFPLPTGVD